MANPIGVEEIVPDYAEVFPFDSFNRMQREVIPSLLESDDNVVVSAPTASGKTALAELAICRTLDHDGTVLFIAPLRALTNEKEREWERFESEGYSVYVVTGERDLNPRRAARADVLVMTPEKVDAATRNHKSPRYSFIRQITCCIIDEVHLLDSDNRGSVLEVTITRLRRLCNPRLIALSATMTNVSDVSEWLNAPATCTFQFNDEYRPVPLHAGVETYTNGENAFADKYRRLYRALDLAEPHLSDDGQALVFVASRQDTVRAAQKATDELRNRQIPMGQRGEYDFHTESQSLENDVLRTVVLDGVGFHHAGLAKNDKDLVEQWFKDGIINLLFSTSTLAWGVNLPARCVVIRDTKLHDPLEGEVDMSPLDILQMLGRAGRPGYDDAGYAYVVSDQSDTDTYRELLQNGKPIESQLASDLAEHLNAEIVLGTIEKVSDISTWLETTFFYVRAKNNPKNSANSSTFHTQIQHTLDRLIADGFVSQSDERINPNTLAQLASRYYLRLPTAKAFKSKIANRDTTTISADVILKTISCAAEFNSVSARRDEREAFNAVLGSSGTEMAPGNRKVFAILQAAMDGTTPSELKSDAWVIRQNALRLLAAFRAFCLEYGSAHYANKVTHVETRVEYGISADAVGLTAIEGVGPGRANRLARAGLTTPTDVREQGKDGLIELGLAPGIAEQLIQNVDNLPHIKFEWQDLPDEIQRGESTMASVTVKNAGGPTAASLRVTVNDVEMSANTSYLGEITEPIGVFGAETTMLEFEITVTFPELPIPSVSDSRSVRVK